MSKKELVSYYYGGTGEVFTERPFMVAKGKVMRCYIEDIEQDENAMNKQELIDRSVNERKGKWLGDEYNRICSLPDGTYCFVMTNFKSSLDDDVVCTKEEFTKRARELGWINGYKWGVEYPTHGKAPDVLNDTAMIEIKINNSWFKLGLSTIPENSKWCVVTHFRIVDQRFKPVESVSGIPEKQQNVTILSEDNQKPEKVSDWYDYDKQQAIGLPPVGVECEYKFVNPAYDWTPIKVNYISENHAILLCLSDEREVHAGGFPVDKFRPLDYNRKADEEKRKFVEAAIDVVDPNAFPSINRGTATAWFGKLYDAGCRFK